MCGCVYVQIGCVCFCVYLGSCLELSYCCGWRGCHRMLFSPKACISAEVLMCSDPQPGKQKLCVCEVCDNACVLALLFEMCLVWTDK